jgi:glyoxylase-like metal-dependent hydrolase (beta-lactamase superfamily II)
MRVHHLCCGTMCPLGGKWVNGDRAPWQTARLVCHVLLIETQRGLVLVDSGIGLADTADPSRLGHTFAATARLERREDLTAARQVEALGFSIDDVRHIVLTHMDLDHASGLPDFPRAVVHAHADEHRAATLQATIHERNRYRPAQWAHDPKFETYTPAGETWRGLECVRALRGLPPEILLVPLIGHSKGHSGIAVESERGWLLHAGDAYFHEGQMDGKRPPCTPLLDLFQRTVAVDREAMRANQARLRELAQSDVRVFSAHDPNELERMRAASGERAAA